MPEKIVARDVQDAWEWLNAQAERLDIDAEEIGIAMRSRGWLIYQIEALAPEENGRLKYLALLYLTRELEADESGDKFERAFKTIVPEKKASRNPE